MIKFDLKSGYHHVDIFEEHQKFLGFSWNFGFGPEYFVFTVLPFGLSSACNIFTKLLKPLLSKWRANGMKTILYLDDGVVTDSSKVQLESFAKIIKNDLLLCGLKVNEEKSVWEPTQGLEWLGIDIDLYSYEFKVPERKIVKTCDLLEHYYSLNRLTARSMARVIGVIIALAIVFGDKASLLTRYMQIFVATALSWDKPQNISVKVRSELAFWIHLLKGSGGTSRSIDTTPPEFQFVLFTDASAIGGGGFIQGDPDSICHFYWSSEESQKSSTFRELLALLQTIYSLDQKLSNCKILWYTDNQNACTIVNKGSMVEDLQDLSMDIFNFCDVKNLRIFPHWVERAGNTIADRISKIRESADWTVNQSIFEYFDKMWGPYNYDRFANTQNSKCENFNSKFLCPRTNGVDCFKFNWHGFNNWLAPPISLISDVILHMQRCSARGTLIVPKWKTGLFWPLLCDSRGNFKDFVIDWVEFKKPKNFFQCTRPNIFCSDFKSDVLVLKISCR